ncbi:hypothetical protein [Synechococcus sp. BDU 130192]|uniref:hypothetical protein n=1 Tax=Synechococcus sp. BDU 130192 TaxID=2042059 RepID=UPI000C07F469|nr:hypothetical protein [Synechococcus sp. BDU 130192]
MNTQDNYGARLQASTPRPSLNLAAIVRALVPAVEVSSENITAQHAKNLPFIHFSKEKKRLRLITSGVLYRLFSAPDFKKTFSLNPELPQQGFICDFQKPKSGNVALLGGQLTEGNQAELPGLLNRLLKAIDGALPSDTELSQLLLQDSEQQLEQLRKKIRAAAPQKPQKTTIQPIQLQRVHPKAKPRKVATVITAKEKVEAENYFERMKAAITNYLDQEDWDEDEIDDAIEILETERERSDSQLRRFFLFLDGEALARVRLKINLGIMASIAAIARLNQDVVPANQLLADYVETIVNIVEKGEELKINVDLSKHFGINCKFDLHDDLCRANFYHCLPIWSVAKTQIFEEKTFSESGEMLQREVSYRFRVNGNNPESGKTALLSRLDDIQEVLQQGLEQNTDISPWKINRKLAELLFLYSVIPADRPSDQVLSNFNLQQWEDRFQKLVTWLQRDGEKSIQEKINEMIDSLRGRDKVLKQIVTALTRILRTQGDRLLEQLNKTCSQQFICIDRDLINWDVLASNHGGNFLRGKGSQEKIEWLKQIKVQDTPDASCLFSVAVTTELSGYNIVPLEDAAWELKAQRVFSPQLLQVLWVPYYRGEKLETGLYQGYRALPETKILGQWSLDAAIQIEYEAETLQRKKTRKNDENSPYYHAVAIAAFKVLVYVTLWRILQRLKARTEEPFTTLMLRFQPDKNAGSQDEFISGEDFVYAAAQSIETVLNQDVPLRMQGLILDKVAPTQPNANYVKKGFFQALSSAFPLCVSTPKPPQVERLGMITYATRPCDSTPESPDSSYLLVSKSYLATAVDQPFSGYKIQTQKTNIDILDGDQQIQQQRLIKEEIVALQKQGCQHILLISNSYGGRKFNRTAAHNNHLLQATVLEEVFREFPNLYLYPLLQDNFPATRLYDKRFNQCFNQGFEINRAEYHGNFGRSFESRDHKDLIPAYTFATLNVVGDGKDRPQSGFCAYFLMSDYGVSNPNWIERSRQHLLNADGQSPIHPSLISLLRGVHFLESEKFSKETIQPVLNPYGWISPTTKAAAGEVQILKSRRGGAVYLSYSALLSHLSAVLHRQ